MHQSVTDLFADAALDIGGDLAMKGAGAIGNLAMRGLRKTPLKRFLPKQSKVANEPSRAAK